MCKLAKCKAQADQQDEDNAAILRKARDCVEQAQADAKKAQADAEQAKADAEQARADAAQARTDTAQARSEAKRARAEAEKIPSLVAEVCAAKQGLAEAQAARLVLEEEVDKMRRDSSQPRQKRKNKNGKR